MDCHNESRIKENINTVKDAILPSAAVGRFLRYFIPINGRETSVGLSRAERLSIFGGWRARHVLAYSEKCLAKNACSRLSRTIHAVQNGNDRNIDLRASFTAPDFLAVDLLLAPSVESLPTVSVDVLHSCCMVFWYSAVKTHAFIPGLLAIKEL